MGEIDLNQIGKQTYKMLRDMKLIPDKDKSDLTLTERENVLNDLQEKLNSMMPKLRQVPSHKYEFLCYLYLSVILYLDNADLNKYIKISVKN